MRIFPFRATIPNTVLAPCTSDFFASVKSNFLRYKSDGMFERRTEAALYIHQIETPGRTYTGIVAKTAIEDYLSGAIHRHEETITESETEQKKLIESHQAQVKPVLLTYRPVSEISKFVQDYTESHTAFRVLELKEESQVHRFWEIIEERKLNTLKALFETKVKETFLADGHHRSAAIASLYRQNTNPGDENPYAFITCGFFSLNDIQICDYNRMVKANSSALSVGLLQELRKLGSLTKTEKWSVPAQKHEIVVNQNSEWYRFQWEPTILNKYGSSPVILDVEMLNEVFLKPVMRIRDVRIDKRLSYLGRPKTFSELDKTHTAGEDFIAFILHPVSESDFLAISSSDGILPPKSTWFEPRMLSGLLVREFKQG